MNIFILDYDFKKCAEYHVDKHVVKQLLEEVQILQSAYYYTDQEHLATYRLAHKNHPCTVWARYSLDNWIWLYNHAMALYDEYTYRYGKQHKSGELLIDMQLPDLPARGLTKHAQAMPDEYKSECAVEAYRRYYNNDKRDLFNWKKRKEPEWITK